MEKTEKIIIGTDAGVWKEAIVLDKNGNAKVVTDRDEMIDILSKFAISEKKEMEELLNSHDKIRKIAINDKEFVEFKSHYFNNTIVSDEINHSDVEKVEENKTDIEDKPKKKIKLKYVAAGAILVAALLGGTVLLQSHYNSDEDKAKKAKNSNASAALSDFLNNGYQESGNFILQSSIIEEKVYTEDEINKLINKLNRALSLDITEIEEVLEGKKDRVSVNPINYEDFFAKGTNEYIAVNEFNKMRNEFLTNATKKNVKERMTFFLNKLNNFIFGTEPAPGTNVYFSELNPHGKYVILAYAKAYVQPEKLKYKTTIYDVNYTRDDLMDLMETWTGQAYELMLQEFATKRR